jgi:glycerol uptake facilitator-like aquaporin
MITVSGHISGGCINPAVGIAILTLTNSSTFYLSYIFGPLIGGVFAGLFMKFW